MRSFSPKIKQIKPAAGIEGGKITIEGSGFCNEESFDSHVFFGDLEARLFLISNSRIIAQIPENATSDSVLVASNGKKSRGFHYLIGQKLSAEVNPVDSPVFDKQGNLYVTFSGKRDETPPVSVYRISRTGKAEPFLTNVPNATSLALDSEGNLYISSRFEGKVYRATPKADVTVFARDLGVPTGLALDPDGFLFVGDRNGRILKISPDGSFVVFAEVPESMVAIHLAFDKDGNLLVSSPGLSSYNHIHMLDRYGKLIPLYGGFGRPQGLTVDQEGNIYVCEAKAGDSSVVRITPSGEMTTLISGPIMVGLALDGQGNAAVASQNAVYSVPLL